jgi:hypothetical protein
MSRRLIRIAALVTTSALVAAGSCGTERADDVDRARIEVMRSDPVFEHLEGEFFVVEGWAYTDHNTYFENIVRGSVDPWRGGPRPDEPTPEQLREQIPYVLETLRSGGWQIHGTRCELEVHESTTVYHYWDAAGYRFHDDVPYRVSVGGVFEAYVTETQSYISVEITTPFHSDPAAADWFNPPPPALPAGETCIDRGEPDYDPDDDTPRHEIIVDPPDGELAPSPSPTPPADEDAGADD